MTYNKSNSDSNKTRSTNIEDNSPIARLWALLDDIDTASDMFKPSTLEGYKTFYKYAMRKSEKRFKYLSTDGYNLFYESKIIYKDKKPVKWYQQFLKLLNKELR